MSGRVPWERPEITDLPGPTLREVADEIVAALEAMAVGFERQDADQRPDSMGPGLHPVTQVLVNDLRGKAARLRAAALAASATGPLPPDRFQEARTRLHNALATPATGPLDVERLTFRDPDGSGFCPRCHFPIAVHPLDEHGMDVDRCPDQSHRLASQSSGPGFYDDPSLPGNDR